MHMCKSDLRAGLNKKVLNCSLPILRYGAAFVFFFPLFSPGDLAKKFVILQLTLTNQVAQNSRGLRQTIYH